MNLKKIMYGFAILLTMFMSIGMFSPYGKFNMGVDVVYGEEWGDWEYDEASIDVWYITGYNGTETNVTIPEELDGHKIYKVAYGTFNNCNTISSITISQGINEIDGNTFLGCTNLENIYVVDNNEYGYYSDEGVLYKDSELIVMPAAKTGTYIMPDFCNSVDIWAFCAGNSLTSIEVSPDNSSDYYSEDGVLFRHNSTEDILMLYPANNQSTRYEIGNNVYLIDNWAFFGCENLKEIVIQNSVKFIGNWSFSDCINLSNIVIPNSVSNIGDWAFDDCDKFTSISIPNGVLGIGKGTFNGCENLSTVIIPASVFSIDFSAFDGCNNLSNIEISDKNEYYSSVDGMVCNKDKTRLLFCPALKTQSTSNKTTFITLAGTMNSWTSNDINAKFVDDDKDGIWSYTTKLAAGEYEFKVVANGQWTPGGLNNNYGIIVKKDTNVTFYFNQSTKDYVATGIDVYTDVNWNYEECVKSGEEPNEKREYFEKMIERAKSWLPQGVKVLTCDSQNPVTNEETNKADKPAPVTSLKQKVKYSTSIITMTWKKVTEATGYEVYRATSNKGKYTKVATTTKTSYKNSKLKSGKTYYYKVRAYKTVNGTKIYGNFSSVTAMGTKTAAPSIKVTAGKKKAKLSWKKVTGANGYEVYMKTGTKGKYKKVKSLLANKKTYTKNKLVKGKKYFFKMRTYRTVGGRKIYSSWSKVKTVKIK